MALDAPRPDLDAIDRDPATVALDYRHELISSRRVEGTPVYDSEGAKLGTIHSVMLDKASGKIAYALLLHGGLFGMGRQVHPVRWDMLRYDVDRKGYVVGMRRERLEETPTMRLDEGDRPERTDMEEMIGTYGDGKLPWWGL